MSSYAGRFGRVTVRVLALSMLWAAVMGSAWGSEWRQFHGNATHRGFNASEAILGSSNAANIELRWSAELDGQQPDASSPAIANGRVFIASSEFVSGPGHLWAFDETTGASIWHRSLGNQYVGSSPVVVNGRVYIGAAEGTLFAFRAWDGNQLWSVDTGGYLAPRAVVKDGVVFVGGESGTGQSQVLALDAVTGAQRWTVAAPVLAGPPTVVGDRVYIAGEAQVGEIVAYDRSTGARIWARWLDPPFGDVSDSSPVVVRNRLYVGTDGDGIYCLSTRRGVIKWHRGKLQTMGNTPAVDSSKVYVADDSNNRIVAYDATSGAFVWAAHGGAGASVILANGVVWGAGADGMLVGVDAATGDVLVSKPLVGPSSESPAIVDGVVYVGAYGPYLPSGAYSPGALMAFGLPAD